MSSHPYDSILWHDYGNHEQGGHIKFHSKSKYLATELIQITHCQHFILPIQVFALEYLSVFVKHYFTIVWCWHLSIRIVNSNTKYLAFTKYVIHSQNTKDCNDYYWSNRQKFVKQRSAFTVLQPKWTLCHKANSKIHNECCNWALMFLRSSQT